MEFAGLGLDVGPDNPRIPRAECANIQRGPRISLAVMEMVRVKPKIGPRNRLIRRLQRFDLRFGGDKLRVVNPERSSSSRLDQNEAILRIENRARCRELPPLRIDLHRLRGVIRIRRSGLADAKHRPHRRFGAQPDRRFVTSPTEPHRLNELCKPARDFDFLCRRAAVRVGPIAGILNRHPGPCRVVHPSTGDLPGNPRLGIGE
jgi:hypothetical protein